MKFAHVTYDWRQGGAEEEWVKAMNELGLVVVADPTYEGSDQYGFFICERKPTKVQLYLMLLKHYDPKDWDFDDPREFLFEYGVTKENIKVEVITPEI